MWRAEAVAANHQGTVEWEEHARFSRTVEREQRVAALLAEPATAPDTLVAAFMAPPLYSTEYSRGFGTLYTAEYHPATGTVSYHWPGSTWTHSFDDFREGTHAAAFREPAVA